MLYNSLAFAVFLPIVFIIYWAVPHKCRWALLLVASYYFYMCWNPKYIILILVTTVMSYLAAIGLERENCQKKKKRIMAIAAVICLGVLFFFKYFNFFSSSIIDILNVLSIPMNPLTWKVILPVGISFYTFQTLSYVIDVYKGDIKAEHHFGYYAAFISFFPQLVAGPIERAGNLLPQIKAVHRFEYEKASYGIKRMVWGYFKKIVIADTLSQFVSAVYDNPQQYQGFALVIATLFFTLQIYCDFSGYSDIAIGTAKLLGIDLMTNFKSPYFSQSVKAFWSRWHISLSTWFRDYVYIPLGGNRVGKIRHGLNLMLTFLASGLWHGANWTFVVWGGIHGIAQVAENAAAHNKLKDSKGLLGALRVILCFLFCSFAWIFFVSDSLGDAFYVIGHLFSGCQSPITYLREGIGKVGFSNIKMMEITISVMLLAIYDFVSSKKDCISSINEKNILIRHAFVIGIILLIITCGYTGQSTFVYFQF